MTVQQERVRDFPALFKRIRYLVVGASSSHDERLRDRPKLAVKGEPELPLPVLPAREALVGSTRAVDDVRANSEPRERTETSPIQKRIEYVTLDRRSKFADCPSVFVDRANADRHDAHRWPSRFERFDVPLHDARLPAIVVVQKRDHLAGRRFDPGVPSGVRAPVSLMANYFGTSEPVCVDLVHLQFDRFGRTVVDDDQLDRGVYLVSDATYGIEEELGSPVGRDDDADQVDHSNGDSTATGLVKRLIRHVRSHFVRFEQIRHPSIYDRKKVINDTSATRKRDYGGRALVSDRAVQMTKSSTDVLLVGTFGGGGIHHYIENLMVHLPDTLATETYDMRSDPNGEGIRWLLTSIVMSIVAAVRFPLRTRPDLVHVHSSYAFSFYRAAFYVFVAASIWRRPIVFHVHGSSFDAFLETDSRLVRTVQSGVFKRCERIIVLSDYWRQAFETRAPERKIEVVPNAVDPELFEPEYDHDPTRVTFVSSLIQRKGVRKLTEAVDELASDGALDFELSIAGSGPLRESVEALAARHERVTYHGFVTEREKRRLFSTGDVFVLPSHAEGLPIAMLEGMAGGNAVVSTTVGSIPEVIDDDGGVLVDPGDATALADAIGSLVGQNSPAGRMGRKNRSLVCEEYAWTTAAERITGVYDEVTPRAVTSTE